MQEVDLVWKIKLLEISNNFNKDRNNIRMLVINQFSLENPWTWTGDNTSKYLYIVENLNNGWKICLRRPANLKNGFDFLILYPNSSINKESRNLKDAPSFKNILSLIEDNINKFSNFKENIKTIYLCWEVHEFYNDIEENILKICKWFFIEQDIRYWNYSWRQKFYNEILKLL